MFLTTEIPTDRELEIIVSHLIGSQYAFSIVTLRKWGKEESEIEKGTFYQLTPSFEDDGFFNWYCKSRPYFQHFNSPVICALYFMHHWKIYRRTTLAE